MPYTRSDLYDIGSDRLVCTRRGTMTRYYVLEPRLDGVVAVFVRAEPIEAHSHDYRAQQATEVFGGQSLQLPDGVRVAVQ